MLKGAPKAAGIDYGGSWLRVVLVDGRGGVLQSVREAAPPAQRLPSVIAGLWKRKRWEPVPALVIGARGVWTGEEKNALRASLPPVADLAFVFSDVELAHWAAFGGKPGMVLIAGTGSIAYAADGRGRWGRADGRALPGGDPGSAEWLGRRFAGPKRRHMSRAEAAQEALVAVEAWKRGDARAKNLVGKACGALARMASQAWRKVGLKRTARIALWGGLFEDAAFRRTVSATLRRKLGPAIRSFRPAGDASLVAARLGLRPANPPLGGSYELQEQPRFR